MSDPKEDYPLTEEEFSYIYGKVPRLCVDIVIKSKKGVLLSLRNIEPCKGLWHLPGGTVYFGESLSDAIRRIAKRELGVSIAGTELLGYIEYPSHHRNGLDSPVSIVFLAEYEGDIKPNHEAAKLDWFTSLPDKLHPDIGGFINTKVL